MEEVSRWSPDSGESASCIPSRLSTPQSVRTLLRSRGSPLRAWGKKLSLAGLSVRGRRTSSGRGEGMGLNLSHVFGVGSGEGPVTTLHNSVEVELGSSFEREVTRALDNVQLSFSASSPPTNTPTTSAIMSSPPQERRVVTGDFHDLKRLPPPDLSQHPVNQEDPLNSISDAPLLLTRTKKEEIQRQVKDARRRFDEKQRQTQREEAEQLEAERLGTVRFKAFPKRSIAFNTGYNNAVGASRSLTLEGAMNPPPSTSERRLTFSRQTSRHTSDPVQPLNIRSNFSRLHLDKDNEETDIYDILKEGSPTAAATPTPHHQSKFSGESSKGFSTPASDGSEQKKSGLRKVTGKFGRSKTESSQADLTSPVDNDILQRPDLESYLRLLTSSRSYDYDPGQGYPRHPETSRGWFSRNLKCTTCTEESCGVCGRVCCAYRAAALAIDIHKTNPSGLKVAKERIVQIASLFPYGREAPTFLRCTKHDEIGCGKKVCPDCCGECPNPICKDIQCRRCKKDPWDECLWLDEDMNRRAL